MGLLTSTVSPLAQAQEITVYSSGQLPVGEQRRMVAYVQLAVPTVRWAVNDIVGGNSTWGTISSNGMYLAPTVVPAANAVRVSATSTSQPDKRGVATLTITQPVLNLWSTWPTSVAAGEFTLSLNGNRFSPSNQVFFGGVLLRSSWVSATELRVSGMEPRSIARICSSNLPGETARGVIVRPCFSCSVASWSNSGL